MFIRVSGLMIKQRERGFTFIKMALLILANGSMISNMGMAMKNGQMAQNMRAIMLRE